ncbi:nep-12 (predicted) [Pycnogonum litorale]
MLADESDIQTTCISSSNNDNEVRLTSNVNTESYRNLEVTRRKRVKERCLILFLIVFVILFSIFLILYVNEFSEGNDQILTNEKNNICYTDQCIQAAAQIMLKMDRTTDPCDDFYQYACGGYIATNEVHPDYPQRSLVSEMEEKLAVLLKRSLERKSEENDNSSAVEKSKLLYKSCLEAGNDKSSIVHFRQLFTDSGIGRWPFLDNYENISVDVEMVIAKLLVYQVQPLFMLVISKTQTDNDTSILKINIFEGLPELVEDIYEYSNQSQRHKNVRKAYSYLMKSALGNLNPTNYFVINRAMKQIDAFEQALVLLLQLTYSGNNVQNVTDEMEMTFSNFSATFTALNWDLVLYHVENALGIGPIRKDHLIMKVWNYDYMRGLMMLISKARSDVVVDYLMWRFLVKYMPFLDDTMYLLFKDYTDVVGLDRTIPFQLHLSSRRWKFCLDVISYNLPIVMTTSYTKTHFTYNKTYHQVEEMIPTFEEAFVKSINEIKWLSEESKTKIYEKVNRTVWKLASPEIVMEENKVDHLHNGLKLNSDVLVENVLEIIKFQTAESVEKLDSDYMRTSGSNPLVVNAFHATELNAIAIPMGVMSPPLLDKNRPRYLNFAGLGTLIGHEFMHGFNNMGVAFDFRGTSNGTLSTEDNGKFKEMAKCFVEQYTKYVYGGQKIDGQFTLGENMCDSEGLELSLQAYNVFSSIHGIDAILPGLNLTIEQIFFVQHAQIWCEVLNHKGYRIYSKDSHSPGKYRVIGAVKNSVSFSNAFQCPFGSKMNPKKKCRIWM